MGPLTQEEACAILSVRASASQEDLRRAWRTLALRWHPDKNLDDADHAKRMFQLVYEGYELLLSHVERTPKTVTAPAAEAARPAADTAYSTYIPRSSPPPTAWAILILALNAPTRRPRQWTSH